MKLIPMLEAPRKALPRLPISQEMKRAALQLQQILVDHGYDVYLEPYESKHGKPRKINEWIQIVIHGIDSSIIVDVLPDKFCVTSPGIMSCFPFYDAQGVFEYLAPWLKHEAF
jgi:hypothetical protein